MRFARGVSRDELAGKIALLQTSDPESGFSYRVKRVVREGKRWILRSENRAHPSEEAAPGTVPIAVLVEVVRPEAIGPHPGERLAPDEMASAFGLPAPPATGRVDGHLFLCIETPGALVAPDRVRFAIHDRHPAETAFVLTRSPGGSEWRYAGVARYLEEEGLWACPAVDEATYRALGGG
jgi:hypothetical protein